MGRLIVYRSYGVLGQPEYLFRLPSSSPGCNRRLRWPRSVPCAGMLRSRAEGSLDTVSPERRRSYADSGGGMAVMNGVWQH